MCLAGMSFTALGGDSGVQYLLKWRTQKIINKAKGFVLFVPLAKSKPNLRKINHCKKEEEKAGFFALF